MRPLELARRFAIYSGVVLFLILCAALAIIWARRSQNVRPYFLYMGLNGNGEWAVYSEQIRNGADAKRWHQLIQESIAARFAADYFRVSADFGDNEKNLWCKCRAAGANDCAENGTRCRLCCASDSKTFDQFSAKTLPEWRRKFGDGESVELIDIHVDALGSANEKGGVWQIYGELSSNKNKTKKIIGFINLERSRGDHADTLGYYVSGFDWYIE